MQHTHSLSLQRLINVYYILEEKQPPTPTPHGLHESSAEAEAQPSIAAPAWSRSSSCIVPSSIYLARQISLQQKHRDSCLKVQAPTIRSVRIGRLCRRWRIRETRASVSQILEYFAIHQCGPLATSHSIREVSVNALGRSPSLQRSYKERHCQNRRVLPMDTPS